MINRRLALGLIALIATIGAACGGVEPTPTPTSSPIRTPTPTLPPTTTSPSAPEPSLYQELLRLIPDTPETRSAVYINDYVRLREVWGIPPLEPDADERAMIDYLFKYLNRLETPDSELAQTATFIFGSRVRQYLGFDLRDVDQSITAGEEIEPSRHVGVLRGRFDPGATAEGITACSECPTPLREEYRGVSFYSWGTDSEEKPDQGLAPGAFDQSGRGRSIAVQGDRVFHTVATNTIKALIDASLGKQPSLADAEEFRLLVNGMTVLGAYIMYLTDKTQGLNGILKARCGEESQCSEELRTQLKGEPVLSPYSAYATGVGKDEDGVYTALVLVHDDAIAAEANVNLLRQRIDAASTLFGTPWADEFDAIRREFRFEGRVLLAKLHRPGSDAQPLWIRWVLSDDPLLLHE